MRYYIADLETTSDPDDCRVWLYGLCEVDNPDRFSWGTSLTHLLREIAKERCVVFFHNLRFDGIFVLDWLMRNGYQHTQERHPAEGEFTSLISKQGQFYQIRVKWRGGVTCEFRDSLKKLPMTVKRISESFGLEDTKGDIDHDLYRPKGWVPTADEIEYVRRDVAIVAAALREQIAVGGSKLTIGADAIADYRKLIGGDVFRSRFPVLPVDIDTVIRAAYRGGWTYVKHGCEMRQFGEGSVYDVNSLYPFVMKTCELPYGFPEYFEGEPRTRWDKPLWVASLTFTARLKPNHHPTIQVKKGFHFSATDYLESIDEPTTLCITSVDFRLWNKHYDIDVLSWNGGYYFSSRKGMFDAYIDKWQDVKQSSTGGKREIAKLFSNSLYGKFATNPDITGKVPIFEDDKVKLVHGPVDSRDPVYTAVGVFVTAHAREYTITAAQANYDTFLYADTDSGHFSTLTPVGIEIDPLKLGAWKHEYSFTRALYARPKAYSELKTNGEWETRIAGLPRHISASLTADDLKEGAVWSGKLIPKIVPGGVILRETDFTLKL